MDHVFRHVLVVGLAVGAGVLAAVGCDGGGSPRFRTVARDELATAVDPTYRLIVATGEAELEQLRALLQDQLSRLDVDFSREVVVAIAGRMPNRGNPFIKKVTLDDGEASVQLGGRGGSKFAGQGQNATPFHAVALRRERVPDAENLRWTAYFDGEAIAATAKFGGRWLPTFKVIPGFGAAYATVAGGYLPDSPPARTTLVVVRDPSEMEGLRQVGGSTGQTWPLDQVDLSTHIMVGLFQGPSGPANGDRIYIERLQSAGTAAVMAARWDDADYERHSQDAAFGRPPARQWAPSYQIVSIPRSFLAAGGSERPWFLSGVHGGLVEGFEAGQ